VSIFIQYPQSRETVKQLIIELSEDEKLFASTSELLIHIMIHLAYREGFECTEYAREDIIFIKAIIFDDIYKKGIS